MGELKTAYLSLGSNLGDTLNNLQAAVFSIQELAGDVQRISPPVYQSSAWGFESEDFLNICLSLQTTLPPQKLLDTLLKIETDLGRIRYKEEGYQARTIDIDILYYERETFISDTLVIPHPEMCYRKFVLKPLADIAPPQFYHPVVNKDTRNLIQECRDKASWSAPFSDCIRTGKNFLPTLTFWPLREILGGPEKLHWPRRFPKTSMENWFWNALRTTLFFLSSMRKRHAMPFLWRCPFWPIVTSSLLMTPHSTTCSKVLW